MKALHQRLCRKYCIDVLYPLTTELTSLHVKVVICNCGTGDM